MRNSTLCTTTLLAALLCAVPGLAQSDDAGRRAEGARAAAAIERVDAARFGAVANLMRNPGRINTALYRSNPSLVGKTMVAAEVAESARLEGAHVLRTTVMMDFMQEIFEAVAGGQMMPGMGINQYEAVEPLTVSADRGTFDLRVRYAVHPEMVLKAQREGAGISDKQYAGMLAGMGAGYMMLGGLAGGTGASPRVSCASLVYGNVSMDYLLVNPSALLFAQGCMLMAQAEHVRTTEARMTELQQEDRQATRDGMAMAGAMQVVSANSREVVFAVPRATLDAIPIDAGEDGQSLRMHTMHVAFDPVTLKELGIAMEGVMTDKSGSRPMSMEMRYSDFRLLEGGRLYEPFRQTIRVQGVLGEAERREIAGKLPELEGQVAQMRRSQPQMAGVVERQVGMMRAMAEGGPIEIAMITTGVALNPDVVADGCGVAGGAFVGQFSKIFGDAACSDGGLLGTLFGGGGKGKGGGPGGGGTGGASGGAAGGLAGILGGLMGNQGGSRAGSQDGGQAQAQAAGQQAAANAAVETPEECMQRIAAGKEKAAKSKRGLGGLVNAASRIAGRFGVGQRVADKLGDAYVVSETGSDLAGAARDFGLTPDEAEVCFNNR